MTSKPSKKSSGYLFISLAPESLNYSYLKINRNFKIAKGAVVCSEALLIGDITIGTFQLKLRFLSQCLECQHLRDLLGFVWGVIVHE